MLLPGIPEDSFLLFRHPRRGLTGIVFRSGPMDHLKIENGKFVLKGATKEVLKAMPPFHYRDRTT